MAPLWRFFEQVTEGMEAMKHARNDYNRIQDPAATNPALLSEGSTPIAVDEPVFLIRAKDAISGDAVRAWAELNDKNGGDPALSEAARRHAVLMDGWTPKQKATAPEGALSDG